MSEKSNENNSPSKKGLIIGIIVFIVLAAVGFGVFAFKNGNSKPEQPDTESVISDVSEKSIHFKDSSLSLKVGEKKTLEIIVDSADSANEEIEYKTDDPSIVKVDEKGNIIGLSVGSTVVTATLKSNSTVTSTLKVTVTKDTDTSTETSKNESKKEKSKSTDTNTDSEAKKNTSSAAASSKPDAESKTVSSAVSKVENNTSVTVYSQPENNDNTNANQHEEESSSVEEVNSTTEDTNSNTENVETDNSNSNNETEENTGNEYIDPYSVGKVYPISYVETDEKKVSISFDASWGNDKTQTILDTLEQYNLKTTFFLVGIWVRDYPDDVKKIAQAGHDIGNHSNTHPDLTQLDMASIRYEMETCSADIEALTGKRPTLFRNPYGAYDNRVIGTALGMGMDCIQWDVDTLDWTNNSGEEICERIRTRIRNGSIILMHNAGGNTADSLPMIIETIQGLGYEIVPISELIPKDGYTTDITGRLTPLNPPENTPSEISEYSATRNCRRQLSQLRAKCDLKNN